MSWADMIVSKTDSNIGPAQRSLPHLHPSLTPEICHFHQCNLTSCRVDSLECPKFLNFFLPTYLPTYHAISLPTYPPTYIHTYLPTYQPTFLPTCPPPTYLTDCQFTYLPICLPTYLPFSIRCVLLWVSTIM